MSSSPREANWPFVTTIGLRAASAAAAGSFCLWLVACVYARPPGSAPETSTAGWTTLALVGVLLSIALRVLAPGRPASASPNLDATDQGCEHEIVWLLSWCVELNSLGSAAMLSPGLVSVLPTLAIILAAEVCLVDRMPARLWARIEQVWQAMRSPTAFPTVAVPASVTAPQPVETAPTIFDSDAASTGSYLSQQASVGLTDDARVFQEGVMKVELTAHQKSDSVAIAFAKAFTCVPAVDLEIESATEKITNEKINEKIDQDVDDLPSFDGEVELDQITPCGMRLTVKRQDAQHYHCYQVHWYAIEDGPAQLTHEQHSQERFLAAKLP